MGAAPTLLTLSSGALGLLSSVSLVYLYISNFRPVLHRIHSDIVLFFHLVGHKRMMPVQMMWTSLAKGFHSLQYVEVLDPINL